MTDFDPDNITTLDEARAYIDLLERRQQRILNFTANPDAYDLDTGETDVMRMGDSFTGSADDIINDLQNVMLGLCDDSLDTNWNSWN